MTQEERERPSSSVARPWFSAMMVVLLTLGSGGSITAAQSWLDPSEASDEDHIEATAVPSGEPVAPRFEWPTLPNPNIVPVPEPFRPSGGPDARTTRAGTAVKTMDDVKLRLTLDRWPLVAGQPTWITTKIKNDGKTPIRYSTDGCEISVGVAGKLIDEQWRPVPPTDVEAIRADGRNEALDFRWRVQEWSGAGGETISLRFVPRWAIDEGDIGCVDVAIPGRVLPGDSVEGRLRWDGEAGNSLGPPPEGLARLNGSFGFRRAGTPGQQTVEVQLDVPVTRGRDPELLHPMEAVDAALAEDRFRELIDQVNLGHRTEEMIIFDDRRSVWIVGACTDGIKWQGNWRAAAIVDGSSGAVRRVLERVTGRPCLEGPWKR